MGVAFGEDFGVAFGVAEEEADAFGLASVVSPATSVAKKSFGRRNILAEEIFFQFKTQLQKKKIFGIIRHEIKDEIKMY